MKKPILIACSVVALAGMTAAAQQPQPQTPPTQQTPPDPPSPSQRPPDPSTPSTRPMADMTAATTVTGCLKTWDSRAMAPATGAGSGAGSAASSTASASPSASEFVLTNVEGSRAASGKGSFLLKTSDASVSFAQHLNHKVSVTGTISDAAKGMGRGSDRMSDQPTADKPAADRDASATGRVGADDAKLPTLNVTAIKMLSPTCGS